MYAQLIVFDGPRSPELVAAGDRATTERIEPLMMSHPIIRDDLVARYILKQPDGGEAVLVVVGHEASFDIADELASSSELLPGEDPRLLPGPTRVERYTVVDAMGPGVSS